MTAADMKCTIAVRVGGYSVTPECHPFKRVAHTLHSAWFCLHRAVPRGNPYSRPHNITSGALFAGREVLFFRSVPSFEVRQHLLSPFVSGFYKFAALPSQGRGGGGEGGRGGGGGGGGARGRRGQGRESGQEEEGSEEEAKEKETAMTKQTEAVNYSAQGWRLHFCSHSFLLGASSITPPCTPGASAGTRRSSATCSRNGRAS